MSFRIIKHKDNLQLLIDQMESYPCSMSCYITQEEQKAGQAMKNMMIKLVKEYLED